MAEEQVRSLDGFSIFGLIIVLLAMVPVLFPIRIGLGESLTGALKKLAIGCRLVGPPSESQAAATSTQPPSPTTAANWQLVLNLTTSPPIAVLILLATTTINGGVIRSGIVGEGDSKPYDVLVLFISLAYIATALDSTGALRSLAFLVSNHTSGSGPQLYFVLYCFFFVFGVIFGNDPIILSGTAFLTYFLKHCGVTNPTAWIFMEFVASNVASAVLVSSNPTNVLLAQAFDLNFLTGFTKFTIIPSLVSAIVGYILLYALFKSLTVSETHISSSPLPEGEGKFPISQSPEHAIKSRLAPFSVTRILQLPKAMFRAIPRANYIPDKLNQPIVNPRSVLVDPQGAFFHGTLMITTLLLLVGVTFIKTASVWHVTMPAGILALIRDIIWDLRSQSRKSSPVEEHELEQDLGRLPPAEGLSKTVQEDQLPRKSDDASIPIAQPKRPDPLHLTGNVKQAIDQPVQANELATLYSVPPTKPSSQQDTRWNLAGFAADLARRFPCTSRTIEHLPLPLLPFAIAMFILISSLSHLGWVTVFARWLASVCTTPARAVYIIGLLGSMVLCPFMGTNIGATILMVNVISDPHFRMNSRVIEDPRILTSAIFATAMSSNIGAFSLTIPSSLAGLLWRQILQQKSILIRNRDFLGWNLLPVLVLSLVSLTIVFVEVMFIFKV
ncbi:hypothetical protein PTTG_00991 [Puccinia triticina 1-1 BBBD Race 1]|uniref:Citrate transporter-like domain-containing protein n=2 Tax=Puccinia triticina TaxID=208348 RepID=A0A180GUR9_PUCT1|nr:uncharacterized protein PtA15_3A756 [Puccinia triticina]OAV96547.1 hypothetical protein PTTG_00991 [Puccinia triticina 1-1 BBBD Race 1]WAQ83386.1 hypothetical protein PtA15_3A756 [Puccinia triticina]WAR54229.1 hypothetical protein PtB15_3B743 [Puccinia triticina]